MKILFYLPVVTPWWFDAIIAPMLRALHAGQPGTELHVMVAPLWRNTGIHAEQLTQVADLTAVQWHVIDETTPDQFRLAGADVPGLLDLVAAIGPDITLARSADFDIARHFPGCVRFIMEAGAPPFASDQRWIILDEEPFVQRALPGAVVSLADDCAEHLRPARDMALRNAPCGTRATLRRAMGLPTDRPLLAVPLHYEHEENFFLRHAAFPDGVSMIEALLAAIGEQAVLAITDHPLNHAHVGRRTLDATLGRHANRVIDCSGPRATERLAICADAMVVDLSKSWSLAAFYGLPLVDIGGWMRAAWIGATTGLPTLAAGGLAAPDAVEASRWFGWHLGARIIDPGTLSPGRLQRTIDQRPSDADIAGNIAMVLAHQQASAQQEAAA
jgi:hypothetical protein